jgi:hypothetical protein
MRPNLGRLPFLGRLSTRAERASSGVAALVRPPIDPDLAPIGPPVLLPAAIVSQVLFDGTELVPAWAKPRAEAVQATTPNEPKGMKRPRRPKATATPAPKPVAAKPAAARPRTRTRKGDV